MRSLNRSVFVKKFVSYLESWEEDWNLWRQ